jgi:hypothetical protein
MLLRAAAPAAASAPRQERPDGVPEWTVQYGGFKHLDDAAPIDATSAWGLDRLQSPEGLKQTAFVLQEGGIWRVTQVLDGIMLGAVDYRDGLGIAVGLGGAIFHRAGSSWQPVPSGTTDDLLDVTIGPGDNTWACGESGTLLRWRDGRWQRYPLSFALSQTSINSCVALPSGEAWATYLGGSVLRWDGSSWKVEDTPVIRRPVQIAFNADGSRAVVAGRGALELAGGSWRSIGDPNVSYRAAAFIGDEAYVVADDRLQRLVNGRFEPVTLASGPGNLAQTRFERIVPMAGGAWALSTPGSLAWIQNATATYRWPVSPRLEGVDLADPGTGWVGGVSVLGGFIGRSASGWTSQPDPEPGAVVWDVDLVGDADGWAASYDPDVPGTMVMWRLTAGRWQPWPIDKTWRLSRLQMLSAEEGWAAGGNIVVRWLGEDWEAVPGTPAGASGVLSVLRGGESPLGWFGSYGHIYRLSGTEWTDEPLPSAEDVRAVDVLREDLGWAVTESRLLGYDGQDWRALEAPKPGPSRYVDLEAVTESNVWVLLDPPALLHWTGLAWEYHDLAPLGGNARLIRLRAVADPPRPDRTDIWLVGSPPTVARYRVLTTVSQLALPWLNRP